MRIVFRLLSTLNGILTLTFSRYSFQKRKKNKKTISNNKKSYQKSINTSKIPSKKFFLQKIKEKLPILYNHKILTKSNRLPTNGAKIWV